MSFEINIYLSLKIIIYDFDEYLLFIQLPFIVLTIHERSTELEILHSTL